MRGGTAIIQGIMDAYDASRDAAVAREREREVARQKRVASVEEMIRTGRMKTAQARVKKQAEQEQGKRTLRMAMRDEATQANSAEHEQGQKTLRMAMRDEAKQANAVIKQMQKEIEADRAAIKQITQRTAKAQETKSRQTADKVQDAEAKNPTPKEAAASEALEVTSMAMADANRAAADAEEARIGAAQLKMQDKIEKENGRPQISGVFAIEASRHAENAKIAAKKAQHAATEAQAAADEVRQAIDDESVLQIVLAKTKAKAKEAHQFRGEAKAAREMVQRSLKNRRKEFDARCKEFPKVRDVDPCGLHASGVPE